MREDEHRSNLSHPLTPLYSKYLRKSTLLDRLICCNGMEDATTAPGIANGSVLEEILRLSESKDFKALTNGRKNSLDLKNGVAEHGADIIRAYLVFHDGYIEDLECSENGIVRTKRWLESIEKAVPFGHETFASIQVSTPSLPNIPETLYEPNLETWLDYEVDMPRSLVLISPRMPEILDTSMDENALAVWLAAQDALNSMIQPLSAHNSLLATESRLMELTNALMDYDDAQLISPEVQYHSTRILLSLIASVAPAFAEECWLALHYGNNPDSIDEDFVLDEDFRALSDEEIEEILADEQEEEDLRHLPRKARPDSLLSIFDQPFPIAEAEDTMRLLRSPSLLSQARAERLAQKEKTTRNWEERFCLRTEAENGEVEKEHQ